MARHPPLRHRVQQLSQVPVALWRRLVNGVAFVVTWFTLWLPGAVTATTLAGLFALWVWSGSDSSLQQTLQLVRPWVPALEALELDDTEASLRDGGRMARLSWTDGQGVSVSATDVALTWDFLPLIKAEPLSVTLKAATIQISDTSPASPTPPEPPDSLTLPLSIQVDLDIGRLTLEGQQPVHIHHLQGTYLYEGEDEEARHLLQDFRLEVAQGRYQLSAALQAEAPMTLSANVTASIQGQLPALGNDKAQTWQGRLNARIRGELAHTPEGDGSPAKEATLTVQAKLLDETAGARSVRPGLEASATLRPWRQQPLHALQAQVKQLNLAAFWPQLPTTLLNGQATVQPTATDAWDIQVSLANPAAGAWDLGKLPLSALQVAAHASPKAVDVRRMLAKVGDGVVQGQGRWQTGQTAAQAQLTLTGVPLHRLHTSLAPAGLSGTVQLQPLSASDTRLSVDLSSGTQATPGEPRLRGGHRGLSLRLLKAQGTWTGHQLRLSEVLLRALGTEVQGSADIATQPLGLAGQLRLRAPGVDGEVKGQLSAEQGQGQLSLQATDLAKLQSWLQGLPGMALALPAPLKVTGNAQLSARWRGGWAQTDGPSVQAQLSSGQLTVQQQTSAPELRASGLQLQWDGDLKHSRLRASGEISQGQLRARLSAQAQTNGLSASGGQLVLDQLHTHLHGAQATQALAVQTAQAITLSWKDAQQWELGPGELSLQAVPRQTAPGARTASATSPLTRVSWQQLSSQQGVLRTEGRIHQLDLSWLDTVASLLGQGDERWLADAGLSTDLRLQGQWQLRWPLQVSTRGTTAEPQLRLELQRQQGDLRVRNPEATDPSTPWVPAELKQAQLVVRSQGTALVAELGWDSRLGGQLQGQLRTQWQPQAGGWALTPQSPLTASLRASLPELSLWSSLMAPPGWRAKGKLLLNAQAGGTLGQPDWQGQLEATDLALRSVVEGLEFGNGRLVAKLSGEQIDITQLTLEGAGGAKQGGTFSGTGQAQWSTGANALPQQPRIRLQAKADKLRLSARADRRLTLSGDVSATLQDQLLRLRGDLAVDQALFILPDETAPSLGDDVVVRQTRAATLDKSSRVKTDLLVNIALGEQLQVRGQGLQTRLGGKVSLVSTPSAPTLRVLGEVRTLDGSYRAYGQQLRISEGVIRFSGPYDDPSLNILAVRPASAFRDSDTQVVGVKITGTARAPRVSLYANPDMPDSEKLAWLVLGRKASGGGAEAAILQQAALALLSGNGGAMDASLASRLGLDDISFRGASTQADGTTQSAGVALGKRLSNRLYMVFETGLNSAMGTVSLFYDVSRRLTLRARAGEENAVDLIFTLPHE
jgi:translocation and assembly module TamB